MEEIKCENHCPHCGAGGLNNEKSEEIDWGLIQNDVMPYIISTCKKCGCEFKELFTYSHTEVIEEGNLISKE